MQSLIQLHQPLGVSRKCAHSGVRVGRHGQQLSWHQWSLWRLGACHRVTVAWFLHPHAQYPASTQYLLIKGREEMIRECSALWTLGSTHPEKEKSRPQQLVPSLALQPQCCWAGLALRQVLCSRMQREQCHRTPPDEATQWMWWIKPNTTWLHNHVSTQTKHEHCPNHKKGWTPASLTVAAATSPIPALASLHSSYLPSKNEDAQSQNSASWWSTIHEP